VAGSTVVSPSGAAAAWGSTKVNPLIVIVARLVVPIRALVHRDRDRGDREVPIAELRRLAERHQLLEVPGDRDLDRDADEAGGRCGCRQPPRPSCRG
jgi:hypothetical protein